MQFHTNKTRIKTTAGGLKSDRNTESQIHRDSVLKKSEYRTIIKVVTRILVKPIGSLLSPPAVHSSFCLFLYYTYKYITFVNQLFFQTTEKEVR